MTRYTTGDIIIPYPDYKEKPYDITIQSTFQAIADEISDAVSESTQLIYDTIGTTSAPGELRQNEGTAGSYALAKGFWNPDDGGGGFFSWVVGSATDDGAVIIVPQGTPSGYWQRLFSSNTYDARWFGLRPANPDNGAYLNNLLTHIGSDEATIVIPHDHNAASTIYTCTTGVTFPKNVKLAIQPGARLNMSNTLLTIYSSSNVIAHSYSHIFSFVSAGSVVFTQGGDTYLPWTGAVGNGSTDDTEALSKLISSLNGVKGRIILPTPTTAYRFSTSKTWTMYDGTSLEIVGDQPRTKIQVNAQLWFFSDQARTATTLSANATRKDKSITLTAVSGIQEGDIVWIYTNVVAENGWNTYKTDTHLVKSVVGSVVNLETPLNFSYSTSDTGQEVTIYRPAKLAFRNLDAEFYTNVTRFLVRGTNEGEVTNSRFFDGDRLNDLTPIEWSRCVNTLYDDFEAEGVLYSTAINFCRNFRATNIKAIGCLASLECASFSDGISVNGLYSYNCANSVGAHPSFNVSYENVIAYDTENTGSIRSLGAVLRNAILYSTVAADTGPVLISTIDMVDASIYNDYDTVLENVVFDFPNWKDTFDLDDTIVVLYGKRLTVSNCRMPGLNSNVVNKPTDIFISDSSIGFAKISTNARIVNTKFEGDGSSGSYALQLYGSIPWHISNCYFKNYETLLQQPVNKLRPFNFTNCYFEDIDTNIIVPFYSGDDHFFHFTECTFYNSSATWQTPEVVNNNLRVTNCHFTNSTTELDFATVNIASGSITGGIVSGTPFSWQNPFNCKLIIDHVIIEITTAGGTAGAVMDIDVVASGGATGDDIFDGIDLNPGTVPVIYDSRNSTDAGTNGKQRSIRMDENGGANDWITGRVLVANSTNLVAKYYIFYHRL